jgi:dienelactone hydrolase
MRRVLGLAAFCLGGLGVLPAGAQTPTYSIAQFVKGSAGKMDAYPALRFAGEVAELGFLGAKSNAIYRPEGQGPFPAVVLVHTCGGLEPHLTDRAKELLKAGFMVLVLDSQGPRGIRSCDQMTYLQVPVVSRDAYAALGHLAQMKDVDPGRIYLVGLSLGSFVAAAIASPELASALGSERRFRATVGWYGTCVHNTPRSRWQLLAPDTDRPVMLLLGGKDTETPIADCFPLVEKMKAEGKPVAWHVYPDATHGWDKSNSQRGYSYNAAVTGDAMGKTIEFLRAN